VNISVKGPIDGGHGHVLYDVHVDGHGFSVTFYPGVESASDDTWRADIDFSRVVSRTVGGRGATKRAAFLAAHARHADAIRRSVPLPAIDWPPVERALAAKGAF
jgi:hypothetical protein